MGIEGSLLDDTSNQQTAQEVISNRKAPSSAVSLFNDASLTLNLENIALLDSSIRSGNATDLLVFRVDELLPLALLAAGRTEAAVASRSAALDSTHIHTAAGDDLLALEALTNLRFFGLGDSASTQLVFDLLTQGMKDSFASLGTGINTVTINSGFYRSNQGLPLGEVWNLGLDFDFTQATALNKQADWSFDLRARALGMEASEMVFGDGNDELTIFTRIDEDLSRQLGNRYSDPSTRIQLERIGMLDSSVQMGAGNDTVRVNGAVINSVIDLGDGNNTLLLEESLRDGSRLVMGKGANQVTITSMLGGLVTGGSGNEVFQFDDQVLAGELDGGSGFDVLRGSRSSPGRRDVVTINGIDQGFFNGLRFSNIQELDTGTGDDVVIMNFNASLSGRLLGGDGLDRLEFLSWQSPVSVDLDFGQATAIYDGRAGAISGFEAATGGGGNDFLAASGLHRGLAGGGGSDTFLLRWTPWETPEPTGLIVGLNPQSDRVVLSGLEATPPQQWDGRSGLPVIEGLDLAEASAVSDQILWERQSGVLSLTPSGAEGVGDARLLPIAPLESLLSGMDSGSGGTQLAVNTTPLLNAPGNPAELVLLGAPGSGQYQTVALLPQASLGVHAPRSG